MEVVSILVLFLPLLLILWLASLADGQRARGERGVVFALVSYLLLGMLWAGLLLAGLVLTLLQTVLSDPAASQAAVDAMVQSGLRPEAAADLLARLPAVGMALWAPAVLGLVLLLPPVRRLIAQVIAIDPASTVHAVALSFTMLVVVNLWVTVAFGLGNLADMTEAGGAMEGGAVIRLTWLQELMFLLMALVGVGFLSRRSLGSSLVRLAIVRPTLRQVALGVAIGVGLALALIPLDYVMKATGIGFDQDVERLGEQFVGPLTRSLFGVFTLGVAAAIGEESLFRGALQPRFGLLLTTVLFALLHSSYGLTASTAIVFVIGLVLGLVRLRYNTTTSMVVHAFYNMSIGLMTYLSLWPD